MCVGIEQRGKEKPKKDEHGNCMESVNTEMLNVYDGLQWLHETAG